MNTTAGRERHETDTAGARRRQLSMMQLIFAGAAAIVMLALSDTARPDITHTVLGSRTVRLTDVGVQLPETPPNLSGGGFAADDGDDQAQQQEQLALQQMQQAEQQAEQQNEQAQQQAQQAEQQGQSVEQHPGP
jgi:hypothetical protein